MIHLMQYCTDYIMLTCQGVSERVQEDQLVNMLEQEKEQLDARLEACKKRRLNELSKRVVVRVKEEIKLAVMEQLVDDMEKLVEDRCILEPFP